MVSNKTTYQKGIWAERLSALMLVLKGYKICKMRYKTYVGEVDIVAKRGNVMVFCEVKYRPDYEQGVNAILPTAQKRIQRTAQIYMSQESVPETMDMRFDVIIISPPFSIKHLTNAWTS